jgi:hypothetical protein
MLQAIGTLDTDLGVNNPSAGNYVDWRDCLTRINDINRVWARQFKHRFTVAGEDDKYLQRSHDLNAALVNNFTPASTHTLSHLWRTINDLHQLIGSVEPGKPYVNALHKAITNHAPLRQKPPGNNDTNFVTKRFASTLRGCRCVDCGITHDWTVSTAYSGSWHRCSTCPSVYCPPCGKALTAPSMMSRTRTCRHCKATTALVS